MNQENAIVVEARGVSGERLLSADFSAKVEVVAEDGPTAKAGAKPTIARVHQVIKHYQEAARISTRDLKTHFVVAPNQVHDRSLGVVVRQGYKATFVIKFTANSVEKAMELHDALTEIKDVEAASPEFRFHDEDSVRLAAFEQAVKAAKEKFAAQCRALGLDQDAFEIACWRTGEEQHRGKTLAYVDKGPEAQGIEPGRATITVVLYLTYKHKANR